MDDITYKRLSHRRKKVKSVKNLNIKQVEQNTRIPLTVNLTYPDSREVWVAIADRHIADRGALFNPGCDVGGTPFVREEVQYRLRRTDIVGSVRRCHIRNLGERLPEDGVGRAYLYVQRLKA